MLDFAKARANMVDTQLRTSDVTEFRLVDAFLTVPREAFVPEAVRAFAYLDNDIALGEGRYLLEPTPLAKLVQALAVREGERALDVGGGTGYGAAILAALGAQVTLLETPALADEARRRLAAAGVSGVEVVAGPLTEGAAARAPFDVILLEGAVDSVPEALLAQLGDGGRLVTVVGRGRTGRATLFVKTGSDVGERVVFDAAVPVLPGFEAEERFTFTF